MPHSLGPRARVLLSSVFGPFACDDEFGSRAINPIELYHNQVTREQGPFSLRMFHRSWGISLIQHNIPAPSTVLDFPTRDSFVAELQAGDYDIVGISSIIVNVGKVREMCRLTRQYSPRSRVIVGGHVAAIPSLESMIDADEIVKGEGQERRLPRFLAVEPSRFARHARAYHELLLQQLDRGARHPSSRYRARLERRLQRHPRATGPAAGG
jgi:hypothetical protein